MSRPTSPMPRLRQIELPAAPIIQAPIIHAQNIALDDGNVDLNDDIDVGFFQLPNGIIIREGENFQIPNDMFELIDDLEAEENVLDLNALPEANAGIENDILLNDDDDDDMMPMNFDANVETRIDFVHRALEGPINLCSEAMNGGSAAEKVEFVRYLRETIERVISNFPQLPIDEVINEIADICDNEILPRLNSATLKVVEHEPHVLTRRLADGADILKYDTFLFIRVCFNF